MISETYFPVLIHVSIVISVTAAVWAIVCLYLHAGHLEYDIDEDWRTHPPRLIRILRWVFDLCTNGAGIGLIDHALSRKERSRIELALGEGGHVYTLLVGEFVLLKWCGFLLAPLTFIALNHIGCTRQLALAASVLVGLLGYLYPETWLRREIKLRKQALQREFPFFLDSLVLTMRAGLGFSSALEQAVDILPAGPVKQEFGRLISEVKCGVNRSDALQRLAERVRLPGLSNFVAVVSQAAESGGSLTMSLDEQSKQRRRERFQRAEKLAGQAPVKLLFPLFIFIFPILFIIIGAPIFLEIGNSGFLK